MYKIGDTPKLIKPPRDSPHFKLTSGKRYKILKFDLELSSIVYIHNDEGKEDFWNINRFQPYKEYLFEKEMQEIINE